MGEIRNYYGKNTALLGGFLISFLFFGIIWIQTSITIIIPVATIGALSTIIAEHYAGFWIDDDFFMQILPAIMILAFTTLFSLNQLYLSTPPLNPMF